MAATIDGRRFRQALGSFTTGVTIVTAIDESGADVGMTANSFNSVSLDPPMVLWSIGKTSTNFAAFVAAPHFAVHVLAADQENLATCFSKRGIDRFAGLTVGRGPGNIPLLDGCAARFQCSVAFRHEGGDHVIIVGEVLEFDQQEREPLLFQAGRYALAVRKQADAVAAAAPAAAAAFAPDFLVYQLGRAYYQILHRILPEVERRGLGLAEFFALSMLGIRERRSAQELDTLVSYTGVRIEAEHLQELAGLGLVQLENGAAELTAQGQQLLVELLAVAKAASDAAERDLEPGESRLLHVFLGRLIACSDPGLPSPWKD